MSKPNGFPPLESRQLSKMTKDQLRMLCRERNLTGYSKKNKSDLIQLLIQWDAATQQTEPREQEPPPAAKRKTLSEHLVIWVPILTGCVAVMIGVWTYTSTQRKTRMDVLQEADKALNSAWGALGGGENKMTIVEYTTDPTLLKSAYDLIEKANHMAPDYYKTSFLFANYYQALNRFEKSLTFYNQSLAQDETFVPALVGKGNVYFKQEQFVEAIACYNQALVIDPEYTPAIINRGFCYQIVEDYQAAIFDFTNALKKDRGNALALNARAQCYIMQDDLDKALADLNRMLDSDSEDVVALNNRGRLYLIQGRYEEASYDLETILNKNESDVDALYNKTCLHALEKRDTIALTLLEHLLTLDPGALEYINDDPFLQRLQKSKKYKEIISQFEHPNKM